MKLSPRELELLHGLPDQGQSSAQPAPTEIELAKAAQAIGALPAELARLHSRLAADEILRQRVYSLQEWDRQLAAALPRVAVPANLELQLRQTLALAEPDVEQAPQVQANRTQKPRVGVGCAGSLRAERQLRLAILAG